MMIVEGIIIKKDDCFGTVETENEVYKFPLEIVYGDKISVGDKVKVRLEEDIPKIITKYEIVELEEFLDVD